MKLASLIQRFNAIANWLQSPLLLVIRLFWGWQFMIAGWGKLTHLERTSGFFADLGIPLPSFNAILAGSAECFGGILLLIGLASRFVSLPLIFTMIVAYVTSERESLNAIFSDPDKFVTAAPFLFLFASLIILAFGPGAISVDKLLSRFGKKNTQTLSPIAGGWKIKSLTTLHHGRG
ncbi:MAG TPA: DoxX family protein [Chthoniobacterales bacterium]